MKQHWLVRPRTVRIVWTVFIAALAATALVQLLVPVEGHFGIDASLAFGAWYGFAACAAMILLAKLIGSLLKRDDTYYDGQS